MTNKQQPLRILCGVSACTYGKDYLLVSYHTVIGSGLPDRTQTCDTDIRSIVLYSTELLEDMLDGCFAVSKHYHRLLGGFCRAPPYTEP